ncbi:hypothetical protein C8Q75DRAFT_518350 [Abortiporus biennis]|nr:hypothetical protein C8Q75DRAFT_518350 [Abortiporus biennis]
MSTPGHLWNWGLFGILVLQIYLYYLSFPNDRTRPKLLVLSLLSLEIVQIILSARDAFRVLVQGWGDVVELDKVGLEWFSAIIIGALVACLTQVFFAWRISVLSGKNWLSAPIVLLSILQLVAGMYVGIIVAKDPFRSHGAMSACDILIAVIMTFSLSNSNPLIPAIYEPVTLVVRFTVETGVVCAISATLDLILFLSFRRKAIFLPLCFMLSKLHSNSVLALLNMRLRIFGGRHDTKVPTDVTLVSVDSDVDSPGGSNRISSRRKDKRPLLLVKFDRDHSIERPSPIPTTGSKV